MPGAPPDASTKSVRLWPGEVSNSLWTIYFMDGRSSRLSPRWVVVGAVDGITLYMRCRRDPALAGRFMETFEPRAEAPAT
jgi:hypothetical protein